CIFALLLAGFGAMYFFLGFMVKRRSTIALTFATALMLLNILSGILVIFQSGSPINLLLPVGVLTQLAPGFSAIKVLKQQTS
ncbi:MAG: hypothetical protein AAFP07_22620, partial [Cyanobacteria bacterium J06606_4]